MDRPSFLKEQLLKLFEGRVILVLDEADLEPLILAAVPALELEATELLDEPSFGNRVKAHQLQRLAESLHALPKFRETNVFSISTLEN
jgi:hypothetical protein